MTAQVTFATKADATTWLKRSSRGVNQRLVVRVGWIDPGLTRTARPSGSGRGADRRTTAPHPTATAARHPGEAGVRRRQR